MAERTTQEATTNTPGNSPQNDPEENDVLGTLVDHIMNSTTSASSFPSPAYFNFGDHDAPDDGNDTEFTEALSQ